MSEVHERVEALLNENWNKVAKSHNAEFSEVAQANLAKEWSTCERAAYPEFCIKNAVALNPALNSVKLIRQQVNSFAF